MRDKTLKKFVANTIEYDETNEPADPFNADGMENYQEVIWRLSESDIDWNHTKFLSKVQAEQFRISVEVSDWLPMEGTSDRIIQSVHNAAKPFP